MPSAVFTAVVSMRAGSEPDARLGQGEGRDLAGGAAGQVLLLELLGAEGLERLRDADRLVRGEQRAEVAAVAADQRHHAVVLDVREAEPAVLRRDLHPEGAEVPQAVEDLLRVLAGAVDLRGVDLVPEEVVELPVERRELRALLPGQREGVDEVEAEVAEEELAHEAGLHPLGLARGLRDLEGLLLGDLRVLVGGHDRSPPLSSRFYAPRSSSMLGKVGSDPSLLLDELKSDDKDDTLALTLAWGEPRLAASRAVPLDCRC